MQVLGLGAPKLLLDSAQRSEVLEMPNQHFQKRKFLPEAWVYVSDEDLGSSTCSSTYLFMKWNTIRSSAEIKNSSNAKYAKLPVRNNKLIGKKISKAPIPPLQPPTLLAKSLFFIRSLEEHMSHLIAFRFVRIIIFRA